MSESDNTFIQKCFNTGLELIKLNSCNIIIWVHRNDIFFNKKI